MADGGTYIGYLGRLIGVSDVPWWFRWALGLIILMIISYIYMISHEFHNPEGANKLQEWLLDAIKIVFGVLIGILSQSAGLRQSDNSNSNQPKPEGK